MARRSFVTPEAVVVVSTDGYFDVYPHAARRPNDRPTYRGIISELGSSVRGTDGRLSVRPDSVALDAAVSMWARQQGAAAVRGDLGLGRTTGHDEPPKAGAAAAAPAGKSGARADAAAGAKSGAKSDARRSAKPETQPDTQPDARA